MLETGTVIDGKYKILNKIGQGGMSVVYLAMNEKANKQWAIKEVRKDVTQNFDIIKQGLITEINMLKKLSHPNLPSIVDVIDTEDTFLIVMDYIEGVTLSVYLEEHGACSQEEVEDWALQLCDVLSYLHTRDVPIIYRDMKPGNIMLKPNGDVVLIDFGIAREYKTHSNEDTVCLGTQGYAAPEQFGGLGQTDARTDIYCLGATLYHLLTGHNPSEPPYEMYPIRHWNEKLSSGFEYIIQKCTQRNPKDRYQNCEELRYALEHHMELDIEYQKKEKRRIVIFYILAFFSLISLSGAIGFNIAGNSFKSDKYTTYIEQAMMERNLDNAKMYYLKAIDLKSDNEQAYEQILNTVLDDDLLTDEESMIIREILQSTNSSGVTYEEKFTDNKKAYEEFSYELGLAYFYSYKENGNKNSAQKWLSIAAKSTRIDSRKVERAKRLLEISRYYMKIGIQSKSGDESISYKDYWEDMMAVSDGNIVAIDNEITALLIYNDVAYQIATHAEELAADGVTIEEMRKKLEDMQSHVSEDVDSSGKNKQRISELKSNFDNNVEMAGRELNIVGKSLEEEE